MSIEPQAKETSTADVPSGDRREDRPNSTAEVAKDLERPTPGAAPDDAAVTLFPEKEANDFRTRWTDIQTGFVDEQRRSVEQADALVAAVMTRVEDRVAAD